MVSRKKRIKEFKTLTHEQKQLTDALYIEIERESIHQTEDHFGKGITEKAKIAWKKKIGINKRKEKQNEN